VYIIYLLFERYGDQRIHLSTGGHKEATVKVVQGCSPLERYGLLLLHVQNAETIFFLNQVQKHHVTQCRLKKYGLFSCLPFIPRRKYSQICLKQSPRGPKNSGRIRQIVNLYRATSKPQRTMQCGWKIHPVLYRLS
jgi:hypothetical protein